MCITSCTYHGYSQFNNCGDGICGTDTTTYNCPQPTDHLDAVGETNATVVCTVNQSGNYGQDNFFSRNLLIGALETTALQLTGNASHSIQVSSRGPGATQTFNTNQVPQAITAVQRTSDGAPLGSITVNVGQIPRLLISFASY
jgi:hypothetical protein